MAAAPPLEIGSILEGVISSITHFGAFIELPNSKTGLVHISEIADTYVRDIKDFFKEGERVQVKVLSVDEMRGKIALSIKQASPDYRPAPRIVPRERRSLDYSFEDKLARFMKDSEDKLSDLRRSTEAKRGGRGSRFGG